MKATPTHRHNLISILLSICLLILATQASSQPLVRPGGSTEVLYSFPNDPNDLSVGRNGEHSFALKIPSFPAYIAPDIAAVYSSRGSDSVMGVGWSLPIPSISLDHRRRRDHTTVSADEQVIDAGPLNIVRNRWVSNKTGSLVCEDRIAGNGLERFACHSEPHGPLRFVPSGSEGFATSWKAQDPYEGVTQHYGEDDATRIYDRNERVVNWLISRETTETGKEVKYFYEELEDSEQRILRAVLVAGDRVIRFDYDKRAENRLVNFSTGVERRQEWLLNEIVLVTGCIPRQVIDSRTDIWTDFSTCKNATEIEKVRLTYKAPSSRFTAHYVLGSWQHTNASGSMRYGSAKFDYIGDGAPTRGGPTANVSQPETPTFSPPDGYSLISNSSAGPMQNLIDWNRDGLADWLSVKSETNGARPWPDPETTDHRLYVRYRNQHGNYDAPVSFVEPLARFAVWLDADRDGYKQYLREYLDSSRTERTRVRPQDLAEAISQTMPDANIGIDVRPWIRTVDEHPERSVFKALSMTVPCARLSDDVCEALKGTYREVWRDQPWFGLRDTLGVKLADLADFNGDGYLDRAVSGLLVTWDPTAPDADANGFRDPMTSSPAIYISYFDGEAQDFTPFKRYSIAPPTGDFTELHPAFVSALAINVTYNGATSPADLSNQNAPRALAAGLGVVAQGVGLVRAFRPDNASSGAPTDGSNSGGSQTFSRAATVTGAALTASSLIANASNAPPEVVSAISHVNLVHSGITGAKSAVDSVKAATAATTGLAEAAGWAQFTSSIVGVAAQTTNAVWRSNTKRRLKQGGYNAAAIVSNTKTGTAIISLIAAGVGIVSALVLLAAGSALTSNPIGWFLSVVFSVLALAFAVDRLFSADDIYETDGGRIKVEYKVHRGVVYRGNSIDRDESKSSELLDWVDLDGDRRLDLVISGYGRNEYAMAVAPGDKTARVPGYFPNLETAAFRPWIIDNGVGSPPRGLRSNNVDTRYELNDSHRGDLITGEISLLDINGDGLIDWVSAIQPRLQQGNWVAGFSAYLNDGTGFRHHRSFRIPQRFLPSGVQVVPKVATTRGLYWTEFAGKTRGFSVGLSNVTQMLGPDIDNNGLPDLVVKDEASYPSFLAGGPCVRESAQAVSVRPLPMDPEPEPTGAANCTAGFDTWFTRFDGLLSSELVYGEGITHLSPAAFDVHSPSVPGKHFVAFNTGEGFTNFVEITGELPSFGGGLSVVSVVPDRQGSPNFAVNGVSNALIDPDAQGQYRLVSMDITNDAIHNLQGSHPVASQTRLGLANADALTKITYPEGGTTEFSYALKKDIKGTQGPPLWVLKRASFDDKVRSKIAELQGWNATEPYVEYDYAGGRWRGDEYLGFESVFETRFSGQTLSQVIQSYHQSGPERGNLSCAEVRGKVLDNFSRIQAASIPETMICTADEDQSASIGVADPLPNTDLSVSSVVPSCSPWASSTLGNQIMPLLQRVEHEYETANTIMAPSVGDPNGTLSPEFRRVANLGSVTTTTFNGSDVGASQTLSVQYSQYPFLTPTTSSVSDIDGLRRSTISTWDHHQDGHWLFRKTGETRRNSTNSAVLLTQYERSKKFPYFVQKKTQQAAGEERETTYLEWNEAGIPTLVEQAGIRKHYVYSDDRENGTGLLRLALIEPGPAQDTESIEKYDYDAMGRILKYKNPHDGETVHRYDSLGLKIQENIPKLGLRSFSYLAAGVIDTDRDSTALTNGQRTMMTEQIGAESIMSFTWWDGFGRAYRKGTRIEGNQSFDLDFDSDGQSDLTHSYQHDLAWFNDRGANYLLQDEYLSANGAAQCASIPYFDGRSPTSYSTSLSDALLRRAFTRDPTGFGSAWIYDIDDQQQATIEHRDGLGNFTKLTLDSLGRRASLNHGGQRTEHFQYSDWDHLLRVVDGAGYSKIWERNAWGQPLKHCQQIDADIPATSLSCPSNWPTETRTYDVIGRLTRIADSSGGVTDITASNCATPAAWSGPSVSATNGNVRPRATVKLNASCKVEEIQEINGSKTELEYDVAGRIITSRSIGGNVVRETRYGYDPRGRMLFRQDPEGKRIYTMHDFRNRPVETLTAPDSIAYNNYDINGALERIESPDGLAVSFTNDLMGRPLSVSRSTDVCNNTAINAGNFATMAALSTEVNVYDRKGRLTRAVAADGSVTGYEWNGLSQLRGIYPPRLSAPQSPDSSAGRLIQHDNAGRISSISEADGRRVEFVRDGRGEHQIRRVISANGRIHQYSTVRDELGRVVSRTPPTDENRNSCVVRASLGATGHSTSYQYAPSGHLLRETLAQDQSGAQSSTQHTYRADGGLQVSEASYGSARQFSYSPFFELESIDDSRGRTWRWKYDANGRISALEDAAKNGVSFKYDHRGLLTNRETTAGAQDVFSYDRDGRQIAFGSEVSSNTWLGALTEFGSAGAPTSWSTASHAGQQPPQISDWTNQISGRVCRDIVGRVQAIEDGEGRLEQYRYDARGRLTTLAKQSSTGWQRTRYNYDNTNRLTAVVAPLLGGQRVTTEYTYDDFARVKRINHSQLSSSTRYDYDDSGNLCTAAEEVKGREVRRSDFSYDPRGRLLSATDDSANSGANNNRTVRTQTYHGSGLVSSVTDETGSWEYTRDRDGRLTQQIQSVSALGMSFGTSYRYDTAGRIASMQLPSTNGDPSGPLLEFTRRDGSDSVTAVKWDGVIVYSVQNFDGLDRGVNWTLGGLITGITRFGSDGQVRELRALTPSTTLQHLVLNRDASGQITQIQDLVNSDFSSVLDLDERGRISRETMPAMGGTRRYIWNEQNTPIRERGAGRGHLRHNVGTDGQLSSISLGANQHPFKYDEHGNRVDDQLAKFQFEYDNLDRLIRLNDTSQGVQTRHSYAFDGRRVVGNNKVFLYGSGRHPIAELTVGSRGNIEQAHYNLHINGSLVMRVDAQSGERRFFISDHRSSPVIEIDGTGEIRAERSYDAFGDIIRRTDRAEGSFSTPIGYHGGYQFEKSPYYLMGHRVYDSRTAQFLTPDPLGLANNASLYSFAHANPHRFSDRTGLNPRYEYAKETVLTEDDFDIVIVTAVAPGPQIQAYRDYFSWDALSATATGLVGSINGTLGSQNNSIGSALHAVDRSLDALTFEAMHDYRSSNKAWSEAAQSLGTAATQLPGDAAGFVGGALMSIPDTLDAIGASTVAGMALPIARAVGTEQDVYDLTRFQIDNNVKIVGEIASAVVLKKAFGRTPPKGNALIPERGASQTHSNRPIGDQEGFPQRTFDRPPSRPGPDPWENGSSRALQSRQALEQAAMDAGHQLDRYVDEVWYIDQDIAPYFTVNEWSSTRRVYLTQQSFSQGPWGLRLNAAHELAHAQQFGFELQRVNGNHAAAFRRWYVRPAQRRAWHEVIAERLAYQRTIRATGGIDFHAGRRSLSYQELFRNQLGSMEDVFPAVRTK